MEAKRGQRVPKGCDPDGHNPLGETAACTGQRVQGLANVYKALITIIVITMTVITGSIVVIAITTIIVDY